MFSANNVFLGLLPSQNKFNAQARSLMYHAVAAGAAEAARTSGIAETAGDANAARTAGAAELQKEEQDNGASVRELGERRVRS